MAKAEVMEASGISARTMAWRRIRLLLDGEGDDEASAVLEDIEQVAKTQMAQ